MRQPLRARDNLALSIVMLVVTCLPGTFVPASAAPGDVVREGTIAAVGANCGCPPGAAFTVAFANVPTPATTPVRVSGATRITRRHRTTLEAIKPGDYLAVTSKRGADGSLTAISISIFPPEYKSVAREGQFPMESGNIMTNATVMRFAERVDGRTLFLKYREGASAIAVPPGTEIQRILLARLGELRKGMRVVVRGMIEPDGSIDASSIAAYES